MTQPVNFCAPEYVHKADYAKQSMGRNMAKRAQSKLLQWAHRLL